MINAPTFTIMINIISVTDFESHPYFIPVGDNIADSVLNDNISKRQRELLISILGSQEYYNLEEENGGNIPTSGKWLDFINGVVYVKSGINIDYKGVKGILQKYVYYWYIRNYAVQMTELGGVSLNYKNSTAQNPTQNITDAYNEVVEEIGCVSDDTPTVYNFLNDHDFNAEMKIFHKINDII